MKQREIPQGETMTDEALAQWAQAFGSVATRYRVACSPGALIDRVSCDRDHRSLWRNPIG